MADSWLPAWRWERGDSRDCASLASPTGLIDATMVAVLLLLVMVGCMLLIPTMFCAISRFHSAKHAAGEVISATLYDHEIRDKRSTQCRIKQCKKLVRRSHEALQ